MNKINATIVADSIDSNGNRLISYIITIPQIIVKELLRHRMFSFSSSSMRAIPFLKTLQDIKENMFIPLAFQKHHNGMQGNDYLQDLDFEIAKKKWIEIGLKACDEAEQLYNLGVTKQICSRIIEPFGYAKILVTATEFDNFFELRCPKYLIGEFRSKKDAIKFANTIAPGRLPDIEDTLAWLKASQSSAEIHIQALAEAMWDARNESTPKQLKPGEWHIPFGDQMDPSMLHFLSYDGDHQTEEELKKAIISNKLKIAVARCARLSYMTFDGEINYEKDIALHDQLLASKHASPFEHVARCMTNNEFNQFVKGWREEDKGFDWLKKESLGWCNNLRGFIPYRYIIENK